MIIENILYVCYRRAYHGENFLGMQKSREEISTLSPQHSVKIGSVLGHPAVAILALVMLGLYLASGTLPFVEIFGDGMGIANGAEEIKRSGLGPNPLTYRYSQNPGTHAVVAAVSVITGLSTTTSLLVLSAIASLVSILCAAALVRRWISSSYVIALVSVLLFQESYSAGYYGNSTVLASAFAFGALLTLSARSNASADVLAGLLFAVAGYMRLDAVLTVPAGIVVVLQGHRSGILRRILTIGSVALVVLALALAVSGFSFDGVRASFQFKDAMFDSSADLEHTKQSLLAFFSLLCVLLMFAGAVALVRERRFDLWALIVAGVLPTSLLYAGGVDTPRYLAYLLPFAALLAARGIKLAWPVRYLAGYAWIILLAAAFVGQYLLSYDLRPVDSPRSRAVLVTLPVEGEPDQVRWVLVPPKLGKPAIIIGVGNNGGRLGTGILLSPRWHTALKRRMAAKEANLRRVLESNSSGEYRIISLGYDEGQRVLQELLRLGLSLVEHEKGLEGRWDRYDFASGHATAHFTFYRYPVFRIADQSGITAAIEEPDPGTILVIDQWKANKMLVNANTGWKQLKPGIYVRIP